MRKALLYLFVFILLLLIPFGIRYLQFYDLGGNDRVAPPQFDAAQINIIPTPPASTFVDEPVIGDGFVLLDQAHNNQFTLEEIAYLDGRLSARGYEMLHYEGGDLASALRPVNAFIAITPVASYSNDELLAISRFVARGGRLLLVGDPSRFNINIQEDEFLGFTVDLETDQLPLNKLANEFDIIFNGDYLYNTIENEGNFRNIILHNPDSGSGPLVGGLGQLAFYGSHSLQVGSTATAVLTADENTWSTATDRPGQLVLAASGVDGHVLAVGDIHFLTNPYHTVFDNGQFIAHIADFLTNNSERDLTLTDFPYFFQSPINLVFTGAPDLGAGAFNEIIGLQDALRQVDKTLNLAAEPQRDSDNLYLGLYNQAADVQSILAAHGITLIIEPPILLTEAEDTEAASNAKGAGLTITPTVEVEEPQRLIVSDVGNIEMSGTALVLLDENDQQRQMVVLAASTAGLANVVQRLNELVPLEAESATADCLLQGNIAFCPTNIDDEPVEMELGVLPPDEESSEKSSEPTTDLEARDMGDITLGETIEAVLAAEEQQAWHFSDGPAIVDIVVEAADDLDIVLELYDPDDVLIESSDRNFVGGEETLRGVDIPDDKTYTILIRSFLDSNGEYTLSVNESEDEVSSNGRSVFIFADDDGQPLGDGFTDAELFASLLGDEYEVQTWVASQDGPLEFGLLDQYDTVIWDSGDYSELEDPFSGDAAIILDFADSGGNLLIVGASPTIFGEIELALTTDVEIAGDDLLLTDGLESGSITSLDTAMETAVINPTEDEIGDNIPFLLRGPDSDVAGAIIGMAAVQDTLIEQRTLFLFIPFSTLPTDTQEILLANFFAWFDVDTS